MFADFHTDNCTCRWKRYQSEEEATLGRGKRLRKAVSYREAYAPHTSGAAVTEVTVLLYTQASFCRYEYLCHVSYQFSYLILQDGGEDEKEPELKKEYTPAGRALKDKL